MGYAQLSEIDSQISLFDSFNEIEYLNQNSAKEPEIEEIVISSYRRSKAKGKREADLDGLPARIIEHRLSDEELAAKFPNGYKELPLEVYKRLHIIPEQYRYSGIDRLHHKLQIHQCPAIGTAGKNL